ncbi:MAG: DUF262 domain-containing protein [Xanthobacteraceae bacterium]|nr:DUF262 domain-containing protein [Xanthobacteraceae bacterium]
MTFKAMDVEPINAAQQSLVRIFSDEYAFQVPPYQRPYAWQDDQVNELLSDLDLALDDAVNSNEAVTYFLGSIVLIKKTGSPGAQVVDGQQRLTTLTILLAVLRDLSTGKSASKRHSYICEEGDPDKGTKDRFRLTPRKKDSEFFRSCVQNEGATETDRLSNAKSESQRLMARNTQIIRNSLSEWPSDKRDDLFAFLMQRCYLVVISVANVETAHKVFTVLNARGLDLTPTDILKADLLDRIDKTLEDKYAEAWEDMESSLGRERFVELFQHIRMIYQKEKPRERLEIGFPKYVKVFKTDPKSFMSEEFERFGATYHTILNPTESRERYGKEAARLLASLLRLDNSDWLPLALEFLSKPGLRKDVIEEFLGLLERQAYFMFVCRFDINSRIARYAKAATQIAKGMKPSDQKCSLNLSKQEQHDFLDELDGPIYQKARVRLPLLLRLDDAFSDGGAEFDHKLITVEHVMPQNPKNASDWIEFDTEEDRYNWTHCIGNLVLLTRAKNSQASNWDFDRKKEEYFSTKNGVSSFRITTKVLKEKKWNEATLLRRHYEAIEKLGDVWDLDYDNWYKAQE